MHFFSPETGVTGRYSLLEGAPTLNATGTIGLAVILNYLVSKKTERTIFKKEMCSSPRNGSRERNLRLSKECSKPERATWRQSGETVAVLIGEFVQFQPFLVQTQTAIIKNTHLIPLMHTERTPDFSSTADRNS